MTKRKFEVALRIWILNVFLISASSDAPPGLPTVTSPAVVFENSQVTLRCASTGGDPTPSVIWYRGVEDDQIVDQSYSTSNGVTVNDYTFIAERSLHGAVFECQVDNDVLQSPLLETIYFFVYVRPNQNIILNGPSFLTFGNTYRWTCTSAGAIPAATITFRIGKNTQLTSGINQSIAQQSDNTYTTYGYLSWSPPLSYNGQTLYCDVNHPETLGTNVQSSDLQLTVNAEPNPPTLSGSDTVTLGLTYQWICVSTGGLPAPTMKLLVGNVLFTTGLTQTSNLQSDNTYTVTTVLTWAPSLTHSGQVLSCFIQHEETTGNQVLTTSLYLTVNAEPNQPTITGPSTLTFGTANEWKCTSTGGRPAPVMTLRIGNTQITSQLSQSSVLQPDYTFTVTSVLTWTPDVSYNGQLLYCDVQHEQTRGSSLQSTSLPLKINAEPGIPSLSGPTTVIQGVLSQWICTSLGGIPAPVLTFRIGSLSLTNEVSTNSVLMSDNTFTVTSRLSLAPSTIYNGQMLSCILTHKETRGNNTLTANVPLLVYAEPNQPTLTGPASVVFETTRDWTCNSTGGNPAPTPTFRIDNTQITRVTRNVYLQTDNTYIVSSVLQWTPSISDNGRTLYCDVKHQETRGNNLQTESLPITVNVEPLQPIITGPNIVILGTTHQWTCNSTRGRPIQTVTMRIDNNEFTTGVSQTHNQRSDNTFTVTSVLTWAPTILNSGQILYCDVLHLATRGSTLQTAFHLLAVYAVPTQPTISGPTDVRLGTSTQWTCTSIGGSPAPSMSLFLGNKLFTSGITETSTQQPDGTYVTTSVLSWSPSLFDNNQNMSCVVLHQATLGNVPQTARLQLRVNAEPSLPIMTGPDAVTLGSSMKWTCISSGGSPAPTILMRLGPNMFTSNVFQTSVLQPDGSVTVTSVLTWKPSLIHNRQVVYCDVTYQDTQGNSLKTASMQLTVNVEPNIPTMTGPDSVTTGETKQWTCISTGGSPAPTLSFRIGDTKINSGVTQTAQLQSDNTFTVTAVLSWTPSASEVGQALFCDVLHEPTRGDRVLSSSVDLSIGAPNTGQSTANLSTGEISAVVLGVIIFLVILLLLICCYCLGCCGYLCGRRKKQVTPAPKKIYKVEIPRFYEKSNYERTVGYKRPYDRNKRVYSAPSEEYQITKNVLLAPRGFSSKEYKTGHGRINTFTTTLGIDDFPGHKYTYDKENELRRMHKRRKMKDRHNGRYSNDKEILVRDSLSSEPSDRQDSFSRKLRDENEIVLEQQFYVTDTGHK